MKKYLKDIIVFFVIVVINCFLIIQFNQLPDWDFYSYHFTNGWAFWNNRLDIDFLPNLFRSYFNPLLDALMYFGIERLNNHPLLFLLISGLKYGFLMFIAFKLYEFLFEKFENFNKYFAVVFCMIMAGSSPIILYCMGFDNTDIPCAVLILLGLYIYLKNIFKESGRARYFLLFLAMFFTGMAFGLKYVYVVYVVSFVLTTICLYKIIKKPLKTLGVLSAGLFAGFMATGGWWFFTIWKKFKNPLFPYFNDIFKSPFANYEPILNMDYLHLKAKNIFEFIFYPLINTVEIPFRGFEQPYFDLKIALSFILVVCILSMLLNKQMREKIANIIDIRYLYFLIVITITTYYINCLLFANIRYLIPLFIIAPVIFYFWVVITMKKEYYIYPLVIILTLYAVTYKGYRDMGKKKYVFAPQIINAVNFSFEDNSAVICANFSACSMAPFQNPNVKYIGYSLPKRLTSYGFWNDKDFYKNQYYVNEYLQKQLKKLLAENKDIYFIYTESNMGPNVMDLELYKTALLMYTNGNLTIDNCYNFNFLLLGYTIEDKYHICKIKTKKP